MPTSDDPLNRPLLTSRSTTSRRETARGVPKGLSAMLSPRSQQGALVIEGVDPKKDPLENAIQLFNTKWKLCLQYLVAEQYTIYPISWFLFAGWYKILLSPWQNFYTIIMMSSAKFNWVKCLVVNGTLHITRSNKPLPDS